MELRLPGLAGWTVAAVTIPVVVRTGNSSQAALKKLRSLWVCVTDEVQAQATCRHGRIGGLRASRGSAAFASAPRRRGGVAVSGSRRRPGLSAGAERPGVSPLRRGRGPPRGVHWPGAGTRDREGAGAAEPPCCRFSRRALPCRRLACPPARRLPWLSAVEGGLWRASFCGVGCSGCGAPAVARRSGLASLSCAGPSEV